MGGEPRARGRAGGSRLAGKRAGGARGARGEEMRRWLTHAARAQRGENAAGCGIIVFRFDLTSGPVKFRQ